MKNFELASIQQGDNDSTKEIMLAGRSVPFSTNSLDSSNKPQGTCAIIMTVGDPQNKTIMATGGYLI